jgi:ABC-type branched-subunit amino acid transport system substrate-binding protein
VFSSVGDYPYSVQRGLAAGLPSDKIVLDQELPASEDFKPFLMRAKTKDSDSFFICLNPGQSGLFARQLRQLQMHGDICGCDNLNIQDEWKNAAGALEGAWLVTAGVSEEFRSRYKARYGEDSAIDAAAILYDVMKIISRAIPGRLPAEKIVEALIGSGEENGAIGKSHFVRTKDDQFLDMQLVVKRVGDTGR